MNAEYNSQPLNEIVLPKHLGVNFMQVAGLWSQEYESASTVKAHHLELLTNSSLLLVRPELCRADGEEQSRNQ